MHEHYAQVWRKQMHSLVRFHCGCFHSAVGAATGKADEQLGAADLLDPLSNFPRNSFRFSHIAPFHRRAREFPKAEFAPRRDGCPTRSATRIELYPTGKLPKATEKPSCPV